MRFFVCLFFYFCGACGCSLRFCQDPVQSVYTMQEAIEEFIIYTEAMEPTLGGQAECYKRMLRAIATGTWHFEAAFNAWRERRHRSAEILAAY